MTLTAEARTRGRMRMRELAAENERDRLALEDKLVRDFGRAPTPVEAIAIETLSATMIRSRRLRSQGRSDLEERKLIKQLLSQLDAKTSSVPAKPVDPTAAAREWLASFPTTKPDGEAA